MVTNVNQVGSTKAVTFNMELDTETTTNFVDDISTGQEIRYVITLEYAK